MRILEVILAALALSAGVAQLAGFKPFVDEFEIIGVGQWFRYVTAVTLIIGAVLLFRPGSSAFGALLLCAVCVGAFFAQWLFIHGDVIHTIVPAIALAVIAWKHRAQVMRPSPRSDSPSQL